MYTSTSIHLYGAGSRLSLATLHAPEWGTPNVAFTAISNGFLTNSLCTLEQTLEYLTLYCVLIEEEYVNSCYLHLTQVHKLKVKVR